MKFKSGGRSLYKQTEEYRKKVAAVIKEIDDKYGPVTLAERNMMKRIFLFFKKRNELNKKIKEILPDDVLFHSKEK